MMPAIAIPTIAMNATPAIETRIQTHVFRFGIGSDRYRVDPNGLPRYRFALLTQTGSSFASQMDFAIW